MWCLPLWCIPECRPLLRRTPPAQHEGRLIRWWWRRSQPSLPAHQSSPHVQSPSAAQQNSLLTTHTNIQSLRVTTVTAWYARKHIILMFANCFVHSPPYRCVLIIWINNLLIALVIYFYKPLARRWRFSVPCSAKPRPHFEHLKGFSPVWCRMCRTKALFSRKPREQCGHT